MDNAVQRVNYWTTNGVIGGTYCTVCSSERYGVSAGLRCLQLVVLSSASEMTLTVNMVRTRYFLSATTYLPLQTLTSTCGRAAAPPHCVKTKNIWLTSLGAFYRQLS